MNRKWITVKGGISISVILYPKFDASISTLFPIAASLALATAIQTTLNLKPEVKWPNDVILNGKKVAGMIVDANIESNTIENMILGVGINFKVDAKSLEKQLIRTENFYGVTSLLRSTNNNNPILLIQKFLYELEKIITLLEEGKSDLIIQKWGKISNTIGKRITVNTNDGKITGLAKKINTDGSLSIIKNGKTVKLLVGDITT